MRHLLKYSLKWKLRSFDIVFWPFIFPLALATLMYFGIGKMEESDFETVSVAVVSEADSDGTGEEPFHAYLEAMENEGDMIRVTGMTEEEALKALENREIEGIYYEGEGITLTVSANGLAQSILQMILESYEEGRQTLEDVARLHPEGMQAAVSAMEEYHQAVEQVSLGGRTTNTTAQFFYALIGMACLYGCFIGFGSAMELQANLTALAARRCAAPVHRMRLILSTLLVDFILHFVNMVILLCYMRYVLKLQFTGSFMEMLPVVLMGSVFGVTMGLFIGSIGRMREGIKIGILLAVSMISSFLAGMMNANIKNAVDKAAPLVNRFNPAAVISDALYCVNVYDAPARYAGDLTVLAVMCVLMVAGAFLMVRRERYGSI